MVDYWHEARREIKLFDTVVGERPRDAVRHFLKAACFMEKALEQAPEKMQDQLTIKALDTLSGMAGSMRYMIDELELMQDSGR